MRDPFQHKVHDLEQTVNGYLFTSIVRGVALAR